MARCSLRDRWLAAKRRVLFYWRWRFARAGLRPELTPAPAGGQRVLVYACDPYTLVGSLGDEAMLAALADRFGPGAHVAVLVTTSQAAATAERLGHAPVALPTHRNFATAMVRLIRQGRYDTVVAMGADVMDGAYGADIAKRMLVTVDLAARLGAQAGVLGFSFNTRAPRELARYFAGIDPRVAVNVRDPVSRGRLQAFAPVRTRLVADCAFTLAPGKADSATHDWIAAQRGQGRTVIGFNLHPMLLGGEPGDHAARLVSQAVKAMQTASRGRSVAWLLLPHDHRGAGIGDGEVLRAVHLELAADPALACRYLEGVHRARDIKALAGALDGVVTGRMHLAIAALGMNTPVLCAAYQDKFAGLYRHFGLDEADLLDRETLLRDGALGGALEVFLARLPDFRAAIAPRIPRIRALALENFAPVSEARTSPDNTVGAASWT